jgi:hypothetical protein
MWSERTIDFLRKFVLVLDNNGENVVGKIAFHLVSVLSVRIVALLNLA